MPNVLFFCGGITHLYNQDILKQLMPDVRFTVLLKDTWVRRIPPKILGRLDSDLVIHDGAQLKEEMWRNRPDLIFFSTANPEVFRCRLFRKALQMNIPTLAIEEVNQLANNDGVINHYFLPVDRLGVASEVEARQFRALGYLPGQIAVTGWPFYSANKNQKLDLKNALTRDNIGLKGSKRIGLLILSFSREKGLESLETIRIRRRMLALLRQGLPQDVQLLVKPHPVDKQRDVEKIVKSEIAEAVVLDEQVPIEDALEICDFVISRGNSQVMFEAMFRGIPLVIVPMNIRTLFDRELPELVANTPDALRYICQHVITHPIDYGPIINLHAPLSPESSSEKVAGLVRVMLNGSLQVPRWFKMLDLCLQMKFIGMDEEAHEDLKRLASLEDMPAEYRQTIHAIHHLFRREADVEIISNLLESFRGNLIRQWHVQALWIRQLYQRRRDVSMVGAGIPLTRSFIGAVNPHYFIQELLMRMDLEFIAGDQEIAEQLRSWFQEDFYFLWDFQRRDINLSLWQDHCINLQSLKQFLYTVYRSGRKKISRFYLNGRNMVLKKKH